MLKRTKRRYLVLEIDSAEKPDRRELMETIWNSITKLYGEYGASQTGLTLIDYNMEEKQATIRVANAAIDIVRAALAAVTKTGNIPAAIHIVEISGTIKSLTKKRRSENG